MPAATPCKLWISQRDREFAAAPLFERRNAPSGISQAVPARTRQWGSVRSPSDRALYLSVYNDGQVATNVYPARLIQQLDPAILQ